MKKIVKYCIGRRFTKIINAYRPVPRLLFQELRQMLVFIRNMQRHANDGEVLLCGLRTRAHIVDKGLQADEWQVGRGVGPYRSLCEQINRLEGTSYSKDPSFQWAVSKKSEYEKAQMVKHYSQKPIEKINSDLSKEDVLRMIKGRRSARAFKNKQIDDETIKLFASAMNWAPTSCNRQPGKLFVTQNAKKITICLGQCAGATSMGEHVPCFISVCADSRFYMVQDRNLALIDASLGLQNMLLLAHSVGIQATPLNWMHNTRKEDSILRSVLNIPDYYMIILNLAIGYPSIIGSAPGRKSSYLTYTIVK